MSNSVVSSELQSCLSSVPVRVRTDLIDSFNQIIRNFRERRWEPAELNGGKFSEAAFCVVQGALSGSYSDKVIKPKNFGDACRTLEQKFPDGDKSLRILIPRALMVMYEIRNNRNVGHLGADVSPNHIDSLLVLNCAKWVLAELVRQLHTGSIEHAKVIVEKIADKTLPLIWESDGKYRVLDPSMSFSDRSLLLLYNANSALSARDLFKWVEHSNWSMFKTSVLVPMHKKKFVEFDSQNEIVQILPPGIIIVEDQILK